MAIIVPEVPKGTVSLGSPLITPGWPLASVEHANPTADAIIKTEPPTIHRGTSASTTHEKAKVLAGLSNHRIV